jgi:adenine-specific DNA-methyltransferase
MGVNISYMGTKRELAPAVAGVLSLAKPGAMLDAFSGMCSVGEQVAPARQVWSNDIQLFAAEVGRAMFTSRDEPLNAIRVADLHFDRFEEHRLRLGTRCSVSLDAEGSLLLSQDFGDFSARRKSLAKALPAEIARLRGHSYGLFSRIYSDSYFGIRQAIEADAIVRAVSSARAAGDISEDHRRWLIIALGRALLKIANATGHFAEFLRPKPSSYERYLRQRKRSLWAEWLFSVGELQPVGPADWRRRNRSFNEDSLVLIPKLIKAKERPSVIYADPPYTDDQYSRYYHLFETLVLYDYPKVNGAGLYRPRRYQAPFSVKSKAIAALDSLVAAAAGVGADMVLSYPSSGLINEAGGDPEDVLRRHFRRVECCCSFPYSHSTFGASKGAVRAQVTELIYLAKI